MSKKIIDVIVNKSWEFEPFFNAITNSKLKSSNLQLPDEIHTPATQKGIKHPMASYNNMLNRINLHCIENWMLPDKGQEYYSNSQCKAPFIDTMIKSDNPDLIISVSTAESTPDIMINGSQSMNGSVIVGEKFYMYDARKFNPTQPSPSQFKVETFNASTFSTGFFKTLNEQMNNCTNRFIPPLNPSVPSKMICVADPRYTSIGVVNIVNYKGYVKGDPAAYNECIKTYKKPAYLPACIETTHGIVKMFAKKKDGRTIPTIFVSPITDRYEHFSDDVDTAGVQNYIAAFNAGIAVSEILVALEHILND